MCPRSTRTHHFSKAVALLVAGRVLVLRQIANARIMRVRSACEGSYRRRCILVGALPPHPQDLAL